MYLLCDGDWDNPEIEISDSSENLVKLGKILNEFEESFEIKANDKKSEFYSDCLNNLVLDLMLNGDDLLRVRIANHNLIFSGTLKAFQNISQSIINFFEGEVKEGDHFHLDYYEGNMVLAQTNCHLIFMCNG
jgi:hypothetical protein